ncbi:CDP-diacylglycerol diphosphatase [Acetobacteraceae bacterium KSS8]|uniref:CDP-diacylglycerol pyrophosphatase n=1 Tax=Endosaccharibacter trunci TaxID=2812733 RepID=A0ABT1W4S5_9PROT|nr:CDP-diacylglycerol diphosphatase [Acetobacteraceae bacterium KSS8]
MRAGRRGWSRLPLAGLILSVLFPLGIPQATASDPDVLWKIVSQRCVPGERDRHDPAPCESVDEKSGDAVLKDIEGRTQYLLIPTAKITGIESPAILADGAPNFFAEAWAADSLSRDRSGHALTRRDFALAINSERGRSQNQLHIHIDCIRPDIRAALDRVSSRITRHWQPLGERLRLHRYRALWIDGETLGDANPFRLLAASLRDPSREMGLHTLVLVGDMRHGRPGFILLDSTSNLLTAKLVDGRDMTRLRLGPGSGEELEDHSCAIADREPLLPDPH